MWRGRVGGGGWRERGKGGGGGGGEGEGAIMLWLRCAVRCEVLVVPLVYGVD